MAYVCEQCGGSASFKKGVKNGKAWAGVFCDDRDSCKHVTWKQVNSEQPQQVKSKPVYGQKSQADLNTMKLAYAKDIVVAMIEKGYFDNNVNGIRGAIKDMYLDCKNVDNPNYSLGQSPVTNMPVHEEQEEEMDF